MIINDDLKTILQTANDLTLVCEIYPADTTPTADGFDPSDAIDRFASGELVFLGETYKRLVKKFSPIKRTIKPENNTASIDFSNLSREIAEFEFTNGFEGLIKVIRLISRSQSDALDKSMILFVGRCEKIDSGTKESLTVKSKYVVGAVDIDFPRRKFAADDAEGRTASDPEFEGFRFIQQFGTVTYGVRERRGGLLGFLGFKKTSLKTLQYSSVSDIDSERVVPFCFGRVQMEGLHLGYIDTGGWIQILTAFCEGEILDFLNARSTNPQMPLNPLAYAELLGKTGVLNGPPDYGWVAPGYYSRTAHIRCQATNSAVDVNEPAPGVAAVILAILVTIPNISGEWVTESEWSDNAAALTRYLLTEKFYHNLDENWIDDASFYESYLYNDEMLFDASDSDFLFVPDSAGFASLIDDQNNYFLPTSSVTPEYFKMLAGGATKTEAFGGNQARSYSYDNSSSSAIPIEPPEPGPGEPPPGGGTSLNLAYYLRRRYTCNVAATEQQKLTDFLHNVVFVSSRQFLTMGANGKIRLKNKKPVDWALATASFDAGANEIDLDDVAPWIGSKRGYLLIDVHQTNSQVARVTRAAYADAQNSVTLEGSETLIVTGFAGCDGEEMPATATIEIKYTDTDNYFILDGVRVDFRTVASDTEATMAGFIYASINAHPVLKRKFKADWTAGSIFVTITAKFGTLTIDKNLLANHTAPLADPPDPPTLAAASGGNLEAGKYKIAYTYANARGETLLSPFAEITVTANQKINISSVSLPAGATAINWYAVPAKDSQKLRFTKANNGAGWTFDKANLPLLSAPLKPDLNRTGAECIRIAQVFSDRAEARTSLTRSNVLKSSYKWQLGNRENAVNQVELTFRDSTQDFKLTRIILKDKAHQEKTKKVSKKELNGQAIDNYNQAYRVCAAALAELRDADFLYQWQSDREALLLEEGDVVAVTDDGARLINFPVFIEDIEFQDSEYIKAQFTARKYATTLFDDSAAERQIPVAIETVSFAEFLASREEFTISGSTPTRSFNASTATLQQTKDALATFIDDYQNKRL